MSTIARILTGLRRPRLLSRAARVGMESYRRERDLRRLFGPMVPELGIECVEALIEAEAELDTQRRDGFAGYVPSEHVAVLTALLAEAALMGILAQPNTPHFNIAVSLGGQRLPLPAPEVVAAQANASGISALRRAT